MAWQGVGHWQGWRVATGTGEERAVGRRWEEGGAGEKGRAVASDNTVASKGL